MVVFWATWCVACREEINALGSYYQQHQADGLRVLTVSMDERENEMKVREASGGTIYQLLGQKSVLDFIGTKVYLDHKTSRFRKADDMDLTKNEAFILSNSTTREQYAREYQRTEVLYKVVSQVLILSLSEYWDT